MLQLNNCRNITSGFGAKIRSNISFFKNPLFGQNQTFLDSIFETAHIFIIFSPKLYFNVWIYKWIKYTTGKFKIFSSRPKTVQMEYVIHCLWCSIRIIYIYPSITLKCYVSFDLLILYEHQVMFYTSKISSVPFRPKMSPIVCDFLLLQKWSKQVFFQNSKMSVP